MYQPNFYKGHHENNDHHQKKDPVTDESCYGQLIYNLVITDIIKKPMEGNEQSANALLLVERVLGTPASQSELNGMHEFLGNACDQSALPCL